MKATSPSPSRRRDDESITETILRAVADAEGSNPVSLKPPLYDVLDPDALEALYDGDQGPCSIEFTYCGYDVHVDGVGDVAVTDAST
ncbi:hypothetical protein G9C85_05940 [Halorubellus sp. JP-L1]|uniref:HalOD1 output domain-containing protein n=1 Tax=Halorubellus sp. JP-L1 TaxID=2715753 RepID=UPI00140A2B16|nr:HalOD1 output domain-containing protein [Halorubellus sp. JP-L1]NHN41177.1 hypothetical protein [Halorubellus sp. JP-L1]